MTWNDEDMEAAKGWAEQARAHQGTRAKALFAEALRLAEQVGQSDEEGTHARAETAAAAFDVAADACEEEELFLRMKIAQRGAQDFRAGLYSAGTQAAAGVRSKENP